MKTAPNDEPTHGKACPSGIDRRWQRRDAARLATRELGVDSLGNAKEFTKESCASTPRDASIHVAAQTKRSARSSAEKFDWKPGTAHCG